MTGLLSSSNSTSSCGACKFLRRKCSMDCVFAPYFSYENSASHFAAVHKVFGASNASKLLSHLPIHSRREAAVTVSYEALARLNDPIYGCVSHIIMLQQQVTSLQEEIHSLLVNQFNDHNQNWSNDQLLINYMQSFNNNNINDGAHDFNHAIDHIDPPPQPNPLLQDDLLIDLPAENIDEFMWEADTIDQIQNQFEYYCLLGIMEDSFQRNPPSASWMIHDDNIVTAEIMNNLHGI
ncbi:LOB domain-containing protein 33-like [Impatiens glandulifera]|uniref:LOB domain-containing protein 33-like n=1 Tax=Impatiens glandulifera TaxID=253017 RepID=UPI001FB13E96|nr:LOB domain-containing protein 33-like [Impatiens glandulifera]